ncbi:MerR family transcriptional regulator [Sandarakinorhabdus sp.]|uniref:MerR family transcriptional regulator n=1 Tax=Sandarakinorhabdus sp. TaxID=1916663 RepID=UPI00286DB040|nr:MerR family transcriptional regulator [Sandarakinorhabdus sp.]
MRMRDLEKASGVGRETIRYYIREGLLPEPDRASRNSASYGPAHVSRLKAIKRLQEERFLPLSVIRTLLEAEDADRWLMPDAFPMLDALLAQRLETAGPARVLPAELDIAPDELAEHMRDAQVVADADGRISQRDAAILKTMGDLAAIGFSRDLGFDGAQMRLYSVLIDWLTTQEVHQFLSHTAGQVGEDKALDMAERGVSLINELLGHLRTRALLRKLAERRRVANDNR